MKRRSKNTVPDKSFEINKTEKMFAARVLTVNGNAYNTISHNMR